MSELDRYLPQLRKHGLFEWGQRLHAILDSLQAKQGTTAAQFVDTLVQPQSPSKPSPATFSVTGSGGVFKVQIVNPQNVQAASMALARARVTKSANPVLATILHNVQSGLDTNFNSNSGVADYGISNQTVITIPNAGVTLYWRIRSSFDGQNWNSWQLLSGVAGPTAVSS